MSSYNKIIRDNMYLKVRKNPFGDELWISPEGSLEEYFLTDTEISYKEVKNWRPSKDEEPNLKLL